MAGENCDVKDVGFDEVLEEMRAERQVRHEVGPFTGQFAENGDVVDFGEAYGHAE